MKVTIYPSRFILDKHFEGSKSLTHRLLIGSWLANEGFILENVPNNDDINATLNFFKALGREIIYASEDSLYIKPSSTNPKLDTLYVDVKSSASTLRFLLPVSLNLAKKVIFKCNKDLINRTLSVYEKLAHDCNLSIKVINDEIICSGSMSLDYYEVDGSISSQFITGLIINAIYSKKAITIKVLPPLESKKHVLMTIELFKQLGFDITIGENETYYIHNNNSTSWDSYTIEGDYSTAANFLVLACLNGKLNAYNLNDFSLQQDRIIVDILKQAGGNIRFIQDDNSYYLYAVNNSLIDKGIPKQLKSINVDLSQCIDLGPILMVLASFTNGTSTFSNINRLKDNESERLQSMIEALNILNVDVKLNDNNLLIKGKKDYFNKVTLSSYNDHRILMALCVFALLNKGCITINDIECINKSYPLFFTFLIKGCKEGAIQIN